jgi:hypothetical protein
MLTAGSIRQSPVSTREIMDTPKVQEFITRSGMALAWAPGASAEVLDAAVGTMLFMLQAGIVIGYAMEHPEGKAS